MHKSRMLLAVVCGLVIVALLAPDAWACPNCKDSLAQNDPSAGGLVRGYFWSILFLLATPFTILTGMCTYFYLLVRQARLAAAAGPGVNPFAPSVEGAAESAEQPAEEMLV